ncbi:MAG: response regulator [Actinomycetota bacterium]
MTSKARVLCVDDEPELLASMRLNLRRFFDITTASSGAEALGLMDAAETSPPFDVVISDMRMPEMNGAALLSELRSRYPEMPRLLLSGQADLDSAIAAINEAKVFRFLTKPCPREQIIEAINEALEQQRLRNVERELLNHTLNGTVSMLAELLGLVSEGAYSRTMRLKATVSTICEALGRPVTWDLGLATMLSQVGYVAIPAGTGDMLDRNDRRHVDLAADLLANIPRMEPVSEVIRHQLDPKPPVRDESPAAWPDEQLHAEILRTAVRLDQLISGGTAPSEAVETLANEPGAPPQFLTTILARAHSGSGDGPAAVETMVEITTGVKRLKEGMELTDDLMLANGGKLAGAGTVLTGPLIARIKAFARSAGVVEPISVLVPSSEAEQAMPTAS